MLQVETGPRPTCFSLQIISEQTKRSAPGSWICSKLQHPNYNFFLHIWKFDIVVSIKHWI